MTWPTELSAADLNKRLHTPGADPGGAPTLQGAPTCDFAKFCEKLHEIEKILGRRLVPPPPHRYATAHEQICLLKCHGDILPVVKIQNRRGYFFS